VLAQDTPDILLRVAPGRWRDRFPTTDSGNSDAPSDPDDVWRFSVHPDAATFYELYSQALGRCVADASPMARGRLPTQRTSSSTPKLDSGRVSCCARKAAPAAVFTRRLLAVMRAEGAYVAHSTEVSTLVVLAQAAPAATLCLEFIPASFAPSTAVACRVKCTAPCPSSSCTPHPRQSSPHYTPSSSSPCSTPETAAARAPALAPPQRLTPSARPAPLPTNKGNASMNEGFLPSFFV